MVRNRGERLVLLALLAISTPAAAFAQQADSKGPAASSAPVLSVAIGSLRREAEGRFRMIARNYRLTEAQQAWLREDLKKRVPQAVEVRRKLDELLAEDRRIIGRKEAKRRLPEIQKEMRQLIATDPLKLDNIIAGLDPQLTPQQREEGPIRRKANEDATRRAADERYRRKQIGAEERENGIQTITPPSDAVAAKIDLPGKSESHRADRPASSLDIDDLVGLPPGPPVPEGSIATSRAPVAHRVVAGSDLDWDQEAAAILARARLPDSARPQSDSLVKEFARRARLYRTHYVEAWIRPDHAADATSATLMRQNAEGFLVALSQEFEERLAALAEHAPASGG